MSCFISVDKYLEFACCSAVPGGGRNKEYAMHLLSHCKGNISVSSSINFFTASSSNFFTCFNKLYYSLQSYS